MSDLEIVAVDPLDQVMVDQWLAVRQAVQDAVAPDLPTVAPAPQIVGLVRQVSYQQTEHWLARRDGQVVGYTQIDFYVRDNRHLADADLGVAPAHCRQGVGTALREHLEQRVAAQGRDTIVVYLVDPIEGGPPRPVHAQAFADAAGYVRGLDEIRRVADLDAGAPAELDRLLAQAWQRAEGYELVQWAGTKPADILDGAAYLLSRMNLDAPTGELDLEQDDMDAQRVREREARTYVAGVLELGTAVRHRDTGAIAGYTEIYVDAGDEAHCWQGNTIVDPEHRGHRLGTVLKIENHRLLRSYRPRMRYVHTWNAEENAHMIAVNEAVGYRAVDRWIAYQKKLPAAVAIPGTADR